MVGRDDFRLALPEPDRGHREGLHLVLQFRPRTSRVEQRRTDGRGGRPARARSFPSPGSYQDDQAASTDGQDHRGSRRHGLSHPEGFRDFLMKKRDSKTNCFKVEFCKRDSSPIVLKLNFLKCLDQWLHLTTSAE